jgi:hypothetical protein
MHSPGSHLFMLRCCVLFTEVRHSRNSSLFSPCVEDEFSEGR